MTINNSTVSGNTAGAAGGIMNYGKLTLNNSTISANHPAGMEISDTGTMTINNSTVSSNTNDGIIVDVRGVLTINNSTVSGNPSDGIRNSGTLTVNSSTIRFNGDGIASHETSTGPLTLYQTIVADNQIDCSTPITSAGYNLDSDGSCNLGGAGDISNTDPLLGPLAPNGGPTYTHALLPGSPAIDAGSGDCPPPFTDQRGVARPADGNGNGQARCDIGAFECPAFGCPLPTPPPPTPTATPSLDTDGDGCSDLRENGINPALGGLRDWQNPYDFYDVMGGGGGPPDGIIDLPNDILSVIQHYSPDGAAEYNVTFDRGPSMGPYPWSMTAPDGVIDLPNDILGVIMQFNHDCR